MASKDLFAYEGDLPPFFRLIREAQRDLARMVREAVLTQQLQTAARRQMQLEKVNAYMVSLGIAVDPQASRLTAAAFTQSAQRTADTIARLNIGTVQASSFAGVQQDALATLQDSLTGRLDASRRQIVRAVDDVYSRAGRRTAVRAILGVDGSPRTAQREMARELLRDRDVQQLVANSDVALIDSAGRGWKLDTYTEMATRTTTRLAVVEGAKIRMAAHGVNIGRISYHAKACPICAPWEGRLVSLDGSTGTHLGEAVASLDSLPNGGPPMHPNCLIPGARVDAVGVYGALRAWYSGDVVELATISGIRLTVTPNHPVMTASGWLPAGDLREGMYVLRGADGWAAAGASDDHHFDDMPAPIEDVFDAVSATGIGARVAAASDDLHGDGRCVEGEIDVVLADLQLRHKLTADLPEQIREDHLMWPDEMQGALVGSSSLGEVLLGLLPASDRCVCGVGGRWANRDTVKAEVLAHGAGRDIGVDRQDVEAFSREIALRVGLNVGDGGDAGRCRAELFGSRAHDHATFLQLAAYANGARAELAREVAEGCPIGVHLDQLVGVNRRAYSGHVFDLSVRDGYYKANTVIVSNCAHSIEPVAVELDELRQDLASR